MYGCGAGVSHMMSYCTCDRKLSYIRRINALEKGMQAMTDEELQSSTPCFRRRLAAGQTLDALLPEAFAVVREASVRILGMRHYDVQLVSASSVISKAQGPSISMVHVPCSCASLSGVILRHATANVLESRVDMPFEQWVHDQPNPPYVSLTKMQMGGMVLHDGRIAEMQTGEGKTLVATLTVYLNALAGHGIHMVTVNDYLAKRDAEWCGTDTR